MVVLVVGLAASVQAREEEEVTITSSGIKVSVVGNKIRIETPIPVVIDVKAPAVDLESAKPGGNLRINWRGPIIIAPTP